jgi:NitT/TauT family transport system permease protein
LTADAVARTKAGQQGQQGPGPRDTRRGGRLRDALTFIVFVIVLVVVWEWYVGFANVRSIIIPRPTEIVHALYVGLTAPPSSRASYLPHLAQTLEEVVAGYAVGSLIGLVLAIASVRFRLFEVLARPLVVAFQSVPKIAIAPLMLVWFGFGFNSKFALVIVATFFPIFVNGITGFRSVDLGLVRMMRSFRASSWQIFWKVQFPSAMPFLFAGLEIGIVHAITSAIAAEFLGGQLGLGVRIIESEQTLDVPSIFAVLVLLGVMGGVLHGLVSLLRRRVVTWTGERLLYVEQ